MLNLLRYFAKFRTENDVGVWKYLHPVSYTHLDVYKRQLEACTIEVLLGCMTSYGIVSINASVEYE